VQGMLVVDETRLKQLPPATVQEWFASGELGLIYANLLSLGNLKRLAQRMAGSPSAQELPAAAVVAASGPTPS